jgi:hypothetical protein
MANHRKKDSEDGPSRARRARPVSELMGATLKSLGVPSATVSEKLTRAWRDACDETWHDHTTLRRLEGGVLEVGVDSDALRDELTNFHRDRLLAVLRAALSNVPLVGIRFIADVRDSDVRDSDVQGNDARSRAPTDGDGV